MDRLDQFEKIVQGTIKATSDPELAKTVRAAFEAVMPNMATELVDIALNAKSDTARLRGIKMYFEIIGIDHARDKQPLNAETIINYYMTHPDAPDMPTDQRDDDIGEKPEYPQ